MYCVKCGARALGDDRFCRTCGAPIPAPHSAPAGRLEAPGPASTAAAESSGSAAAYAGFWRRFVAATIDALIVFVLWLMLSGLFELLASAVVGRTVFSPDGVGLSRMLAVVSLGRWGLLVLLIFAYYAVMESTARGASLGKRAMKLRVTTLEGERAGILRSTARTGLKVLSAMLMMVGYLMAGFTRRKQALHDLMSRSLVVRL